jgi:hypothetical protein
MKTHPDLHALGVLRANAFQKNDNVSEEEMKERNKYSNHSMNGPIYHPDTDVYVMAEDGRFASGCEALINGPALEADIERVCTYSDFRRRGFARAAILECMHRLKEIGIHNAYITGYGAGAVALYGALGHADEVRSFVYEMPV